MDTPLPHTIVAIDGPAASGKSTVARTLARRLGFTYVNTGAMYRAVTWYVLSNGIAPTDTDAVSALLRKAKIDCGIKDRESTFHIDGLDLSPNLLAPEVNEHVSRISAIPDVRQRLVALQRDYIRDQDIVMEGRDIGSTVFPETPYKFYIDASAEVRAMRRSKQGVEDAIAQRDRQDSSRPTSPLTIAEDAHVIDSSHLTIDGVVGEIIGRLKMRGLKLPENC